MFKAKSTCILSNLLAVTAATYQFGNCFVKSLSRVEIAFAKSTIICHYGTIKTGFAIVVGFASIENKNEKHYG